MQTKEGGFTQDSIDFQRRISLKNGVSDSSACPVGFRQDPVTLGLEPAREEAKMVLFGAVREVLARTGRALLRLPLVFDTSAIWMFMHVHHREAKILGCLLMLLAAFIMKYAI